MKQVKDGVLEFNCKIFGIPNSPCPANSFWTDSDNKAYAKHTKDILNISHPGYAVLDDEILLEVWIVALEDLDSENLRDHGATILNEAGEKIRLNTSRLNFLPAKLFEGKKEGDIVDIIIPDRHQGGVQNEKLKISDAC